MGRIEVNYIGHSGFLLETEDCLMLFDHYRGSLAPLEEAPQDKPLFVFVSHAHADHYNPEIFSLADGERPVTYLLSSDVKSVAGAAGEAVADHLARCFDADHPICYLEAGVKCEVPGLGRVRTFVSTDEGVAFLIETGGAVIYHAGDLNWWDWPGEPADWLADQERVYKQEIAKIAPTAIDLAMIVVDDRLESGEMTGPQWFLQNCRARFVFPMHFWNDRGVVARFEELARAISPDTKVFDTADQNRWEVDL